MNFYKFVLLFLLEIISVIWTGKRIGWGNVLRGSGQGETSDGEMVDGEVSMTPIFTLMLLNTEVRMC